MPILSSNNPTLADVAKRTDPNGKIDTIVELLAESNEVLTDMTSLEGNLPTGHRTTVRTGLPEPTWQKITDNCGMLEAFVEVDKALADLNGNTTAFRLSEDRAHLEGINQTMASTLFYGNEGTQPAAFTGLAPRYNSLTAENKDAIINAGGTGADNTSIWLIVWDANTVHAIYPKGSNGGLHMKDHGEVTIENVDGTGGRMIAYRTHYRWDLGLTVRDWRYAVRICNIPLSQLSGNTSAVMDTQKALVRRMVEASERIPALGKGRAAWYVNRHVREALRLGILEKIAGNLSWETVEGKRVMTFDDIPVRRTDALLNTEARVA